MAFWNKKRHFKEKLITWINLLIILSSVRQNRHVDGCADLWSDWATPQTIRKGFGVLGEGF